MSRANCPGAAASASSIARGSSTMKSAHRCSRSGAHLRLHFGLVQNPGICLKLEMGHFGGLRGLGGPGDPSER